LLRECMSKKNNRIPILINTGKSFKKLFYVTFLKDGSIKLTFPKEAGYVIAGILDIAESHSGYNDYKLNKLDVEHTNPELTFHPGKGGVIHVSTDLGKFKEDAQILSYPNESGGLFGPLVQLIYPGDESYLDSCDQEKYKNKLIINTSKVKTGYSLEIWIHNNSAYSLPEDLPNRECLPKCAGYFKLNNLAGAKYACSFYLYPHKAEAKDTVPGIIVNVPNGKQQYIFEVKPIRSQ
jgi:hypothetical protein